MKYRIRKFFSSSGIYFIPQYRPRWFPLWLEIGGGLQNTEEQAREMVAHHRTRITPIED